MDRRERRKLIYFFLEVFGRSLDSLLFRRAALFLWISFLLAALSTKEIASSTLFADFLFFAALMANLSSFFTSLLTFSFLFELLKALLAVFVTGTHSSIIEQG